MSSSRLARIVSGGQTGADRAALDAAIATGLNYGGWCPAGGWAEDYPEPPGLLADYPQLMESHSREPDERTHLNVRDSHATLILRADPTGSPGTDLTSSTASRLGRALLITDSDHDEVLGWLAGLGHEITLNVAGPRESEQPGLYARTRSMLERVITEVNAPNR